MLKKGSISPAICARGFFSPELEAEGLMVALQGLAENITERFRIDCVFDGQESVQVRDSALQHSFIESPKKRP